MSWLSKLWHQTEDFVSNIVSPKPPQALLDATNAQTAAVNAQTAAATKAAADALQAQKDANNIAASKAVPASDSESARAAADDQRRKLLLGSSFGIGLPATTGAPPVGFRLLSGA